MANLIALLRMRASLTPDRVAYLFLDDRAREAATRTYGDLDRRAIEIATTIRRSVGAGERALLLYPPGPAFLEAFFGCLYAGVIGVPLFPPVPGRSLKRVFQVAEDAKACAALTVDALVDSLRHQAAHESHFGDLEWLATDGTEVASDPWIDPAPDRHELAYLQYTSGSTSSPKGVMISHANVLHNCEHIMRYVVVDDSTVSVTWLPHFHDMGLVKGLMLPIYVGFKGVVMPPGAFVQQPIRWLQTIMKYGASVSGGPDFAYDLCVRRIRPEQRRGLDLSGWTCAFNGSEPVRKSTMTRFVEAFEPSGFRARFQTPCYGLAEATLLVTAVDELQPPRFCSVDAEQLAQRKVVPVPEDDSRARVQVGCGRTRADIQLEIVDPATCLSVAADEVGEIWIAANPSLASGYWNRPEETAHVFAAELVNGDGRKFLRTGDLGYLQDGELFIAGRLKDLIIVDGRNVYPHDIEETVEKCHPAIRSDGGMVVSVETEGREQIVIVQELRPATALDQLDPILNAILRDVSEHHAVPVYDIALVESRSLAKTSSGKKQRRECRAAYEAGTLRTITTLRGREHRARMDAPQPAAPAEDVHAKPAQVPAKQGANDIAKWLVGRIAEQLQVDSASVDRRRPFAELGLASRDAVSLAGELESRLQRSLPQTLLYDFPTIERLAAHLASNGKPQADIDDAPQAPVASAEPIAIIGIGCRFPGADGPQAFWKLLREGVDAIREIPADRWDSNFYYDADVKAPGKMNTRWGGFLEGLDGLDASFFGISPREGARLDPQQRLLLEVAWEALEDAGIPANELSGSNAGVFIGISGSDYGQLQLPHPELSDAYAAPGSALSIAANRLSYFFDLCGPSLVVDTACSSSLVAVQTACDTLRHGDSSIALAGGVNVILNPEVTVNFSKAGLMSADGRCKTFDARANGYVRSEGAGVVVLKTLTAALAAGDEIYAVIRGGGVNQDGRSNGLMAPNPGAQARLLRSVYRKAGLSPSDLTYVEAHGTGTLLGDPIELNTLGEFLATGRSHANPCPVGSVKTNIGHLEAAAGMAGLIKVALMIHHGEIPPSLHFENPNPNIRFSDLPIRVPRKLESWDASCGKRIGGVSSFGFGGTNAHLILEQPTATAAADAKRAAQPSLLTLSAKSDAALLELARRVRITLQSESHGDSATRVADLCHTFAVRRVHHSHRFAAAGSSVGELIDGLTKLIDNTPSNLFRTRKTPSEHRLAFVFSGQGAMVRTIGRQFLETKPVFRAALEECDEAIGRYADWSLQSIVQANGKGPHPLKAEYAQPMLTAIQISLARLWRSWGIGPAAVVGHSLGEMAAAHIAGVFSLDDTMRIALLRGRALDDAGGGGRMLLIALGPDEVARRIAVYGGRLCIAAYNSPAATVVSGDDESIGELLQSLERERVPAEQLNVSCAFHSHHVDGAAARLQTAISAVSPAEPQLPVYSTVTGRLATRSDFEAGYWSRNLRESVRFQSAVEAMLDDGVTCFVEISQHPLLCTSMRQTARARESSAAVFSTLREKTEVRTLLLKVLGQLYSEGFDPNWRQVLGEAGKLVRMPTYPWQRRRHWLPLEQRGTRANSEHLAPEFDPESLLHRELELAVSNGRRYWQTNMGAGAPPTWAAVYADGCLTVASSVLRGMAVEAARRCLSTDPAAIGDIELLKDCVVRAESVTIQTIAELAGGGGVKIEIHSRASNSTSWELQFRGVAGYGSRHESDEWLYETQWQPRVAPKAANAVPADFLPSAAALAESVGAGLSDSFASLERFAELPEELERLATLHVVVALETMGFVLTPGVRFLRDEAVARLGISEKHHALFDRLLCMLEEDGVLERGAPGEWRVATDPERSDPGAVADQLVQKYPDCDAELALLARCGPRLPDVLRGACNPLELIFPGGSLDMTTKLYQHSPLAQVFNAAVRDAVATAVKHLPEGRRIRILELGGGTGGTTAHVLPVLDPERTDYTFTDLSQAFLTSAQRRFREHKFVRFAPLDIEQSIESQGFEPCGYDLVIAANVLHATADLRQTLGHVQRLLAPRGQLVLYEITFAARWLDLVFGLTDGWWRLRDTMTRSHTLLDRGQWTQLLHDCGFRTVGAIPGGQKSSTQSVLLAEAPQRVADDEERQKEGHWILLADEGSSAFPLQVELELRGQTSSIVLPARTDQPTFADAGRGISRIRFDHADDLRRLVETCCPGSAPRCRGVVRLTDCGIPASDGLDPAGISQASGAGVAQLAALTRQLASTAWSERPKLWVVTRGAQSVRPDEATSPVQGTLWGLGRVIGWEHPDLWGGLIDLDSNADVGISAKLLATQLLATDREDQTAIRGEQRHVLRLVRAAGNRLGQQFRAQRDGCYWITGGFGGLGLEVAKHLANRGVKRIVLLNRTEAPPRERWSELESDPVWGPRIVRIRGLERSGIEVRLAAVDIADARQLEREIADLRTMAWLPIRGVVHAAGVMQDTPLSTLNAEIISDVLRPKVQGSLCLDEALADQPLDFFASFSSVASQLGIVGQGLSAYAAANAFLDSFVLRQRRRGVPAIGINWAVWDEAGRAAHNERIDRMKVRGFRGISVDAGLQILDTLLASRPVQATVLPVDWQRATASFPALRKLRFLENLIPAEAAAADAALPSVPSFSLSELFARPQRQRESGLRQHLSHFIAQLLGLHVREVDENGPLTEMGFDSLMAIELKNQIQSDLGVAISLTGILDGLSVARLAKELLPLLESSRQSAGPSDRLAPQHSVVNSQASQMADTHGFLAECQRLKDEDLAEQVDQLSDAGVEAMLNAMLNETSSSE